MGSDAIVTEGKFANLKLYIAEHCLSIDIKETLYTLYNGLKMVVDKSLHWLVIMESILINSF